MNFSLPWNDDHSSQSIMASSSSLVDPADMTKLARALVNPDKTVRDKTCFNLTTFFSATSSFTDMEMLKLWKALYYCMWLSDKNEIQTELAAFLCSVVDDFPKTDVSTLYIRMFFRTMLREWSLLDQHRLNKFYRLLRFMMRKIFMLLHKHKFASKLTQSVLKVLDEEVFNKVPNGVRFHLFDVFLEELYVATDGDISTSTAMTLLSPLLKLLSLSRDTSCQDRISKIFTSYLSVFAAENKVGLKISRSGSSSEKGPSGDTTIVASVSPVFMKVDTKALQALVFSLASDATTPDANRSKLYAIHKQFAAKTGMAFVEESILLKFTAAENSAVEVSEPESSKKNNSKKRASDTIDIDNNSRSAKPTTENETVPTLKKKKQQSVIDSVTTATTNEAVTVIASTANISKNKNDMKSTFDSNSASTNDEMELAEFIVSKKFEGAKPGYAFKKVCM